MTEEENVQTESAQSVSEEPKSKAWIWVTLGIIILLIIVVAVVVGISMMEKPDPDTESEENSQPNANENTDSATTEMLTYENTVYGVRIKYPSTWTEAEQVMGTVVALMSPQEGPSDLFKENLNIVVQDLSDQPMTLDEYTTLSIEQVKQFITNMTIIESGASILDNNPAHKIVYTGNQGLYNLKWMQIWTIKDDTIYILSHSTEDDQYDNFVDITQEMVNSFEII